MILQPGTLFVVALPIGNWDDITLRAVSTLRDADLILCEDTRKFGSLKKHLGIETPLLSFFEHNEKKRLEEVIDKLKNGMNIALVSDAGTPLISDPGFRIVRECSSAGIQVSPIPGPSACIAALSCCGCETDQFIFLGFLPQKEGKKHKMLEKFLALQTTLVCYESPYRIIKTLKLLQTLVEGREIFCAKELTKTHEAVFRGSAEQIISILEEKQAVKGEFVVIVGKDSAETDGEAAL